MSNKLHHRLSGRHRLITGIDSSYYTFIPDPLCEDLEIEIDTELATLLSTANRLLGQLEGMSGLLPNVEAVESIFLCKEAFLSCQIDEIDVHFYDIIDATKKDSNNKNVYTIYNYTSAMKYGMVKQSDSQYQNTLLCEIQKEVMKSDNDESIGKYRTEQIFLGKTIVLTNMEQYNPTAPDNISAVMKDLEKFINRKDHFDVLIKTALAYYQFETVQPFRTGNGRVGRILPYLILSERKLLTRPIVCLSHYMNINRVECRDRIQKLQNLSRDYEQWIKFYIKAIIFAADDSLARIKNWLCIREKNLKKIGDGGKTIKAIKKVYNVIEHKPIIDINTLADMVGISYNTSASALRFLSDLGIIRQSNMLERNRDYAYKEFLDCYIGEELLPEIGESGYRIKKDMESCNLHPNR